MRHEHACFVVNDEVHGVLRDNEVVRLAEAQPDATDRWIHRKSASYRHDSACLNGDSDTSGRGPCNTAQVCHSATSGAFAAAARAALLVSHLIPGR